MQINNFHNTPQYQYKTPCFQHRTQLGKCIDEFIKPPHAEEIGNKLIEKLKTFLENPKKLLGEGFRGVVYKIDDKYVLKCSKYIKSELENITHENRLDVSCLKTYYGAPVLTFDNGTKILRNASSNGKQMCAGIPAEKSITMLRSEKQQYWSETYLPVFAELPQKSFDAIAKDFSALNKIGMLGTNYSFDTKNPNNIVLVGNNTLRIVDDLDRAYSANENTTGGLLRLFLEKMDLDYLAPKDISNQAARKTLLKKLILAGEKYELPLLKDQIDLNTWRNITEEFCEYKEITEELKKYRRDIPDKKIRLEKIKEFLDDILEQNNSYDSTLWVSY